MLSEGLTIEVRLSARDVRWALFQVMKRAKWLLLFPLMALAMYLLGDAKGAFVTLCLAPALFVVIPWAQAATSMRNPQMSAPIRHTFTAKGIQHEFRESAITVKWDVIQRATESEDYIGIWGKTGVPVAIPKPQLTAEELGTLRQVLRDHVKFG